MCVRQQRPPGFTGVVVATDICCIPTTLIHPSTDFWPDSGETGQRGGDHVASVSSRIDRDLWSYPGKDLAVSNPVVPPPSAPEGGFPTGEQPAAPAPDNAPAPTPAKKKNTVGKIVLRIVGALVVGLIIIAVKSFLFGDEARLADVGDCVKATQQTGDSAQAEVVDCGTADAAYTVVGRVAGVSDIKSKECEQYFKEGEAYAVYSSSGAGGQFLLCLRPNQ